MGILTTFIVPFFIVLGILIFVHEFGHFIVAKWLGVRVEKFSLGFGPRIVGFTRGETEYRISLLPLGGYVKLAGEEPDEELKDDPGAFSSHSVGDRAKIVVAGPLMNMILPFIFFPMVYMLGVDVPAYRSEAPVVGWVEPDSPAEKAGLLPGDLIVEINDSAVETWEKVETLIVANPENAMEIAVVRDGTTLKTELVPAQEQSLGSGYAGLGRQVDPVIKQLTEGYPAAQAGMQVGDRIVAIEGEPVNHWYQISRLIEKHYGDAIEFTVQRGDETILMLITPQMSDMNGEPEPRPLIGIALVEDTITEKYGFFESILKGGERVLDVTGLTFYVLKQLVTGQLSMKALGGPILIAKATGHAAESGLANLLGFVAFLSINLAILNILPIPILDGGHLLFFLIEFIRGKPLGMKKMEMAQQVGFALLILLMVVVTYNDILRLLPDNIDKYLPWR